ncbi:MAG: hypothetical protein RLZZ24_1621 [Pseudomonadota bacterium]
MAGSNGFAACFVAGQLRWRGLGLVVAATGRLARWLCDAVWPVPQRRGMHRRLAPPKAGALDLPSMNTLRIGLTGGIGSGKSTVGQMLAQRGAALIDADAISRATTGPQGAALDAIAAQFGAEFITPDQGLDRARMRARVFADPLARQQLEAIVHPLVSQETQRQTQQAIDSGHSVLVFDVPLLVESGRWRAQVDRVLVIDCTADTQIARVTARSQLAREEVQRIMAAQASRLQRLAAADWVIYNDGLSLDQLQEAVQALPMV